MSIKFAIWPSGQLVPPCIESHLARLVTLDKSATVHGSSNRATLSLKDQNAVLKKIGSCLLQAAEDSDLVDFTTRDLVPWCMRTFQDPANASERRAIVYFLNSVYEASAKRHSPESIVESVGCQGIRHVATQENGQALYTLLQLLLPMHLGKAAIDRELPWMLMHLEGAITESMSAVSRAAATSNIIFAFKAIALLLPRVSHNGWEDPRPRFFEDLLSNCHSLLEQGDCDLDIKRLAGMVSALIMQQQYASPQEFYQRVLEMCDALLPTSAAIVYRSALAAGAARLDASLQDSIALRIMGVLEAGGNDTVLKILVFEALQMYASQRLSGSSDKNFVPSDLPAVQKLVDLAWSHLEDNSDLVQFKSKAICDVLLKELDMAPKFIELTLQCGDLSKVKYVMLSSIVGVVGFQQLWGRNSRILHEALDAISVASMVGKIAEFIGVWMANIRQAGRSSEFLDVYQELLLVGVLHDNQIVRKHMASHLLKPMLSGEPDLYARVIGELEPRVKQHAANALEATLAVERVARNLGMQSPLAPDLCIEACTHTSEQLRLALLGLMSDVQRNAQPLTAAELGLLRRFLCYNMSDASPEFREGMQARFVRIFDRMRNSAYSLHRKARHGDSAAQALVDQYEQFLTWVIEYVFSWLHAGCPFQRAMTSMQLIEALIKSFGIAKVPMPPGFNRDHCAVPVFPFRVPIDTEPHAAALLIQMSNTYEDVQQFAFRLVQQFTLSTEFIRNLLLTAREWMASLRPSEYVPGAMLKYLAISKSIMANGKSAFDLAVNDICEEIRAQIQAARTQFRIAARLNPLPGHLYSLHLLLCSTSEFVADYHSVLNLCEKSFETVEAVLSHESPEGIQLEDLPGVQWKDGDCSSECQVFLSFSWRVAKHAADLLGALAARADAKNDNDLAFLKASGSMLLRWMMEIRHRGAFTAIGPNVSVICAKLCETTDFPLSWLKDTLSSLSNAEISVTRRSGGLPYVFLALLTPSACQRWLSLVIKEIFAQTESEVVSIQVNSMNILRRVFEDGSLTQAASGHVSEGFMLSVRKLAHTDWAVRNAGLMLFSVLVARIFGTKKNRDERHALNKVTGNEFFRRFPATHAFLFDKLQESLRSANASVLFPLLTLLARMAPSVFDESNAASSLAAFAPFVMQCASLRVWKAREMAADAMLSLISADRHDAHCEQLLEQIESMIATQIDQNLIHGLLLQLRNFVKYGAVTLDGNRFERIVDSMWENGASPYSIAVALEIASQLLPEFPSKAAMLLSKPPHPFGYSLVRRQLLQGAFRLGNVEFIGQCIEDQDDEIEKLAIGELYECRYAKKDDVVDFLRTLERQTTDLNPRICRLFLKHHIPCGSALLSAVGDVPVSLRPHMIGILAQHANDDRIVGHYVRLFYEWSDPESPLELRQACVESLEFTLRLRVRWVSSHPHELSLLILGAAVYLAQDDDEDVREACAEIVGNEMFRGPLVPSTLAERLFACLPPLFETMSPQDQQRLTLKFEEIFLQNVRDLAARAISAANTSDPTECDLFHSEPANLYKDKLLEAFLLGRTLMRVSDDTSRLQSQALQFIPSNNDEMGQFHHARLLCRTPVALLNMLRTKSNFSSLDHPLE